jgi:hypothetical protein
MGRWQGTVKSVGTTGPHEHFDVASANHVAARIPGLGVHSEFMGKGPVHDVARCRTGPRLYAMLTARPKQSGAGKASPSEPNLNQAPMKKYQLTPGIRVLGTVMVVFGILGGINALLRAGDFPDAARTNAFIGAVLLVFGLGLRARQMWAWWGLTVLAAVSVLTVLGGVVWAAVGGDADGTLLGAIAIAGVIWGAIFWALLRGRKRVSPSAEPPKDTGF